MNSQAPPKSIRYLRILMAILILRLAGALFFPAAANGTLESYFAVPFGISDFLVGLGAIAFVYYLPKGGVRTYALAVAWNIAGLFDLLAAAAVSTLAGLYPKVSAFFGPAIVLLPIDIIDHIVILGLLLGGSVAAYFARNRIT